MEVPKGKMYRFGDTLEIGGYEKGEIKRSERGRKKVWFTRSTK
jgi:hypothetical protein